LENFQNFQIRLRLNIGPNLLNRLFVIIAKRPLRASPKVEVSEEESISLSSFSYYDDLYMWLTSRIKKEHNIILYEQLGRVVPNYLSGTTGVIKRIFYDR
jgi:hypothetical protein